MTNVAIITTHPFNYSAGTAVRVKEIAYELARSGNKVYILNPFEKNHVLKENLFVVNIPNLPFKLGISDLFYRFNRKLFSNRGLANKVLLNISYFERTSKILRDNILPILRKYDIEIVQAEQEIAALACVRFGGRYNIVSDLHNLWAEELVASKTISYGSKIYEMVKDFEKKIIDESDSTVVASEALKSYLVDNYDVDPSLINVIYNGGRTNIVKDQYSKTPNKIVYSGMIDYRQNISLFVNAMPTIKNRVPDAEFYLSKKGDEMGKIMKLIKQRKCFVNFTWFENEGDYYNFLKSCDIGVLTSSEDIPRQLGLPSKLFNYIATGIPVVANDIGGWTDIIRENKIGVLTKNDPVDFAEKTIELLSNPDKIEKMGRNGVDIINKEFNWRKSAEHFMSIYDSLN